MRIECSHDFMPASMSRHIHMRGFTLVELAVVLVIVGLMLVGLLVPLSAQMDQRNYSETRKSLEEIREALIGYGLSHGYLPCPTSSVSSGAEERTGSACTNRVGFLPWAELGVPKLDSWGHLYRYSVTPAFADSSTKISLSPFSSRDITIQTRDDSGNLINLSNANNIPAVVVSHGKNGTWGYMDSGTQIGDSSTHNDDEDTNGSGAGTTFVSRNFSANTTTSYGEFDDIVIWVSPHVYLNRMVAAGQLP
jgi:prepilin-type N-terminal cleavage/methylation domain-containing protein